MIKAQKLKTYDPKYFKPGWASVKLNGLHAIYDGSIIYSRKPKEFIGLTDLLIELKKIYKYIGSPIAGELILPGADFETLSGLLRNSEETPDFVLNIFAVIGDLGLLYLEDVLNSQPEIKQVKVIPQVWVETKQAFDAFFESSVLKGYEGVCWQAPDFSYNPGKRNWTWMKRVPFKSIEVLVIDVLPGTKGKKFENTLGSFLCSYGGKKFSVGIFKGFNTAWRDRIWAKRKIFKNQIATIEFKDFSKYGVPLQPRFKGFRWEI